jgi:hypothetical protein
MLPRVDLSLDRAVVLFQDGIQVRHRPVPNSSSSAPSALSRMIAGGFAL